MDTTEYCMLPTEEACSEGVLALHTSMQYSGSGMQSMRATCNIREVYT